MGLFNHLFGNEKSLAEEMDIDDKKRLRIFSRALRNYPKISKLAENFSHKNAHKTLENRDQLERYLDELNSLTSTELVGILDEVKNEKEILADLERLASADSITHTDSLRHAISVGHHNQKLIIPIFKKIFEVLKSALHLVKIIRIKILNNQLIPERLLTGIFDLLHHQLRFLYGVFNRKTYMDRKIGSKIHQIAVAVILGRELKEEEQTAESKFVQNLLGILEDGSEHYFRNLGNNIFSELAGRAGLGSSVSEYDYYEWINHFESFLYDDEVMFEVINKYHRKSDTTEIKAVMEAFRRSYHLEHFQDLIVDLYEKSKG